MRFLVTGALGHIGSRLLRELPREFDSPDVTILDNLSTQRLPSLFDLPEKARYRFVEGDIRSADLPPLVQGVDAVVHLAGLTDAATSFERADEMDEINFRGAVRVAEACAAAGVPMIFASTTSVYGPQGDEVDETCGEAQLNPQSPYAAAKLKAENALASLRRSSGLAFVTCRFGTIFGVSPGMRFHTVVNKFCWQAVMGLPLTVWRTALQQKRPYLAVDDAVRAIALVCRKRLFDGRVFNVLTANATVNDIIEILRESRPDLEVKLVDSPIMNQQSYTVRDDRIRGEGFVPAGDLKSGILATLDLLGRAQSLAS